jgi:imidazole glycerol-phosphate synthase subunit HisH
MIVVVDYKMGNIGSILNMFKKIGISAISSSNSDQIEKAEKLILPGVGSFDAGMENLKRSGLIPTLNEKVIKKKTPILGICLGMQLFGTKSEEGGMSGLGWIDAETARFKFSEGQPYLKIPHMGWNNVILKRVSELYKDMPEDPRFYFVHSYHLVCNNEKEIVAKTFYGYEFASIVQKENIYGVQFHPEKSHKFGMKLLKNFAEIQYA